MKWKLARIETLENIPTHNEGPFTYTVLVAPQQEHKFPYRPHFPYLHHLRIDYSKDNGHLVA